MITTTKSTVLLLDHPRYAKLGHNRFADGPGVRRALQQLRHHDDEHRDSDPVRCPCGAREDADITRCDRNGLPHPLVLCRVCGMIRLDPQPSAERLAWFYTHVYRAIYGPHGHNPEALFAQFSWKGERIATAVHDSDVHLEQGPIVDIGCGGGWTLAPWQHSGRNLIGYDFDADYLAIGRDRGFDLRHGGADAAAHDGVRAALLICAHVLEHTKDPRGYLASLRPLVLDNGLLYLEVPHLRHAEENLLGDSLLYWQRAHLWDFQQAHLEVIARRAGWCPVASGANALSVHLLCRRAEPEPDCPLPPLGPEVEARLLRCEARRTSLAVRGKKAVRTLVRAAKNALRSTT